jgi:glycosyltransferase involved in cell wall biosynthesis
MNVLYLGCNGFPEGYAQVQKQKMIGKALVESGCDVKVISYKGVLTKQSNIKLRFRGEHAGIRYIFASFTASSPANFFSRNILKGVGTVFEFLFIVLNKSLRKKNIAIITTGNLNRLKYYSWLLRILDFKVVLSYEELWLSTTHKSSEIDSKKNFDVRAANYCDALLPISAFLETFQRSKHKHLKMHRIPALADFDLIDAIKVENTKIEKILFCGASAYFETISFIMDAFQKIKQTEVRLVLVIHGNEFQNQKVYNLVRESKLAHRVEIKLSLPYDELIRLYKSVRLLLIPLNDTERDRARFPHKISEYVASRTPMVTTAVGEINNFFVDGETAFVSKANDVIGFAEKITFALENPDIAEKIGRNAFVIGKEKFDYKSIGKELSAFLSIL